MKGPKISSLIKLSVLLLLLHQGGKHGYQIIKDLGKRTGKKISPGEIYPFLKNLEKYDLVVTKKVGSRDKKIYFLTASGKTFVRGITDKFNSLIDAAVKAKLSICAHCGCEVYRGAYHKIIKGRKTTFCCIACAQAFKSLSS